MNENKISISNGDLQGIDTKYTQSECSILIYFDKLRLVSVLKYLSS